MKEQNLVLKNVKSFNLTHIFECGQCFRWNKNEDGSYTGVVGENVINIKMIDNNVYVKSFGKDNLNELVHSYFDMDRDYEKIKKSLRKIDEHMKESISYGDGIRLLNQDLWETIISFIISANNNIPRIKGIIERISKRYGNRIIWDGAQYYSFPTPKQLGKASVEELRNLGLGFRDVRVYETTQMVVNGEVDFDKLHNEKDTQVVRDELLKLPGVGPKVADCILLFSTLKRLDVFPIDVWVRRVMNELYIHNEDENKVDKKLVLSLANDKFADLQGIAQQYLFFWKRGI
ncbi:MAG: 8-oxoguanine DNA glycosylase [Clostridia bacterium]|nr:8-oxoguanine DNA glycosylase [Clostridia bacterium]